MGTSFLPGAIVARFPSWRGADRIFVHRWSRVHATMTNYRLKDFVLAKYLSARKAMYLENLSRIANSVETSEKNGAFITESSTEEL